VLQEYHILAKEACQESVFHRDCKNKKRKALDEVRTYFETNDAELKFPDLTSHR